MGVSAEGPGEAGKTQTPRTEEAPGFLPGVRTPEGEGRSRAQSRPGRGAGAAAGRVPRVSGPARSPGLRQEKSPGSAEGKQRAELHSAARGTLPGHGTHRAGGSPGAGRRGAGRVLPPQAGLEALHDHAPQSRSRRAPRATPAREP